MLKIVLTIITTYLKVTSKRWINIFVNKYKETKDKFLKGKVSADEVQFKMFKADNRLDTTLF
jgi:hypothetical protein